MASPTVIGSNTTYSPNTTGNQSFSHTVPSTGQNRALIVISTSSGADPSAITYNSVSMSRLTGNTPVSFDRYAVWYLANPSTGANTVSSTAGAVVTSYLAFTLQDIVQSAPLDGEKDSGGDSSSFTSFSNTITPSPASDSLTISFGAVNSSSYGTLTHGTGQTELQPVYNDGSANHPIFSSYKAGAATVGESWTTAVAGYDSMAFALKYLAPTSSNIPNLLPLRSLMGVGI